jgi:hypothetical protein
MGIIDRFGPNLTKQFLLRDFKVPVIYMDTLLSSSGRIEGTILCMATVLVLLGPQEMSNYL